jgi:hypothetical protein
MIFYWVLFSSAALATLVPQPAVPRNIYQPDNSRYWKFVLLGLVLAIGFRQEVGGDWFTYSDYLFQEAGLSVWETLTSTGGDPAYRVLNWFGANIFGEIYFTNVACALIFSYGLIAFVRTSPRPWLALLVAIPYLVIVVAMGYSRQGVAIGLVMLAMTSVSKDGVWKFLFWVGCAALFHKSAVILAPMAIFIGRKNILLKLTAAVVVTAILYQFLLKDFIETLFTNYLEAEFDSAGALIRVTMNAVPSILLLIFWKRFNLTEKEKPFWLALAVTALLFLPALYYSPSSTAIDRVALFWIPLQMFVFSRLPEALGQQGRDNIFWIICIVVYSAVVFGIWVNFAVHAENWLPYRFMPLELLWE